MLFGTTQASLQSILVRQTSPSLSANTFTTGHQGPTFHCCSWSVPLSFLPCCLPHPSNIHSRTSSGFGHDTLTCSMCTYVYLHMCISAHMQVPVCAHAGAWHTSSGFSGCLPNLELGCDLSWSLGPSSAWTKPSQG